MRWVRYILRILLLNELLLAFINQETFASSRSFGVHTNMHFSTNVPVSILPPGQRPTLLHPSHKPSPPNREGRVWELDFTHQNRRQEHTPSSILPTLPQTGRGGCGSWISPRRNRRREHTGAVTTVSWTSPSTIDVDWESRESADVVRSARTVSVATAHPQH